MTTHLGRRMADAPKMRAQLEPKTMARGWIWQSASGGHVVAPVITGNS